MIQQSEQGVNSLAIADIKQGASVRVVLALLASNKPMSYAELMDATGISERSLYRALDELISHNAIKRTGVDSPMHDESRTLVHLTAHIDIAAAKSAYELAQEAESQEDHINAAIAIYAWAWDTRLERRYALQLLRFTNGNSPELYERLENTKANPTHPEHATIDHPFSFTVGILKKQSQKEADMQSWQIVRKSASNGHSQEAEQELDTRESIEEAMGLTLEDFANATVTRRRGMVA